MSSAHAHHQLRATRLKTQRTDQPRLPPATANAHKHRRKPIESDRLIVYCQPLPREPNPLPASKVLVSALPYSVERITNTSAELAMQA